MHRRHVLEIREVVEVSRPPEVVFPYLAEFQNLTAWDPGAVEVKSRTPGPLALGTAYEVVSAFRGREIDLRYVVTEYEPPRRIVLHGDSDSVTAVDEISFEPNGSGTRVTYVARFGFKNPLVRLIAPLLLGRAFRSLGREAAAGMAAAVDQLPVE
jgi:carbon monoxide dehydrogenase subunit G